MTNSKLRITTVALFLLLLVFNDLSVVHAETNSLPSSWATQKIAISAKAGITTSGFDSRPYTDNISRRDFCELLINSCHIFGIAFPEPSESHPFTDTTDSIAENAYWLGLTQGTDTGIFSPDQPLTREMAAVMLSKMRMLFQSSPNNELSSSMELMDENQANRILSEYSADSDQVSDWAKVYMADVYTLGILSGTGEGKLDPKSFLTREQAVLLTLNMLTYCDESHLKAAGITDCVLPVPTGIFISPSYNAEDIYLFWNPIPLASAYDITVFKNDTPAYTTRIDCNYIDLSESSPLYNSIFGSDKQLINAGLKVIPVNRNGDPSIFSLKKEFTLLPFSNYNEMITGDSEKNQFADSLQAKSHMTDISVPVWKLTGSDVKEPDSLTITVNKNVADTVKKIFEEIYNGKERFPIHSSVGFAFRDGTSQHSNGTAIDINPVENYFVNQNGVIKSGSLWKPGINPYSILPDGDVVRAFNHYGWHWSPDMNWPNGKDYMHFSLIGR